jgi:hypothetical protein
MSYQRTYPTDTLNIINEGDRVIGVYKDVVIKGVVTHIDYGWGPTNFYVDLDSPITVFGSERTSIHVGSHSMDWKEYSFRGDDFLVREDYYAATPAVAKWMSGLTAFQKGNS